MSELFDLLRNLYGASGGVVPGPAWTGTIATLLWMLAYGEGLVAGQHVASATGDPAEVEQGFRKALAERLGWTDAELEEFWNNPRYDFGPDDARRFDESYDAWEGMIELRD
jgi:hypothetical protein